MAEVVGDHEEHRDGAHAIERGHEAEAPPHGEVPVSVVSAAPMPRHCRMWSHKNGHRRPEPPVAVTFVTPGCRSQPAQSAQCVLRRDRSRGRRCRSETLAVPRRHRAGVGLPRAQVVDPDRRAAPEVRAGVAAVARCARCLVLEDRGTTVAGRRRERHRHAVVPGSDRRDRRSTRHGDNRRRAGSRPEPTAPTAARIPCGFPPRRCTCTSWPPVRLRTCGRRRVLGRRPAHATVARRAGDLVLEDLRTTVTGRRRVGDSQSFTPATTDVIVGAPGTVGRRRRRQRHDRRRLRRGRAVTRLVPRHHVARVRLARRQVADDRRRRVLGRRAARATVARRTGDPVVGDRRTAVVGRRRIRDHDTAQPGRHAGDRRRTRNRRRGTAGEPANAAPGDRDSAHPCLPALRPNPRSQLPHEVPLSSYPVLSMESAGCPVPGQRGARQTPCSRNRASAAKGNNDASGPARGRPHCTGQ